MHLLDAGLLERRWRISYFTMTFTKSSLGRVSLGVEGSDGWREGGGLVAVCVCAMLRYRGFYRCWILLRRIKPGAPTLLNTSVSMCTVTQAFWRWPCQVTAA